MSPGISRKLFTTSSAVASNPTGIEAFSERHEAALFTDEEYRQAFVAAGLSVEHDSEGLIGRGLYIGQPVSSA